jgi:ATP/maltotriose-dependent transcriptional regulator MalT
MTETQLTYGSHTLSVLEGICPGLSALKPVGSSSENAALLANYLGTTLHEDVVYVLDDIHLLDSSSIGQRWLRILLEHLPRRCHLVLIGRSLPALPWHDLLARKCQVSEREVEKGEASEYAQA